MAKYSSQFILAPSPVRLAFCQLATAKADKKGRLKFGATLLIPKTKGASRNDDPALAPYRGLIAEVLKATRPNGPVPSKLGIRDGDIPNDKGNIPSGFAGCWVIGCTSNYAVAMYDENAKKILDERKFYSGCWAIPQVNAYWFEGLEAVGVTFGLGAVQFHHDGEKLGAAAPAPNFTAVPGSAAAAGAAPTGDNPADMFGN